MHSMTSRLLFSVLGISMLLGGCSWVGRTAGQIQAQMERNTEAMREGYHEGYQEEKSKPVESVTPAKAAQPSRFTHATSSD